MQKVCFWGAAVLMVAALVLAISDLLPESAIVCAIGLAVAAAGFTFGSRFD